MSFQSADIQPQFPIVIESQSSGINLVDYIGRTQRELEVIVAASESITQTVIPAINLDNTTNPEGTLTIPNITTSQVDPFSSFNPNTSKTCDFSPEDAGKCKNGICVDLEMTDADRWKSFSHIFSAWNSAARAWMEKEFDPRTTHCLPNPNSAYYDYLREGLHGIQTIYESRFDKLRKEILLDGPIVPEVNYSTTFHNGKPYLAIYYNPLAVSGKPITGFSAMVTLDDGYEIEPGVLCYAQPNDPNPLCYELNHKSSDGRRSVYVVFNSAKGIGNSQPLVLVPVNSINATVNQQLSELMSFYIQEDIVRAYSPFIGEYVEPERLFLPFLENYGIFFSGQQEVNQSEVLLRTRSFIKKFAFLKLTDRHKRNLYRFASRMAQYNNQYFRLSNEGLS